MNATNEKTFRDRNARRRERYATDPSYRKSVIERERQKRTAEPFDCRENLPLLGAETSDGIGVVREYEDHAETVTHTGLTFTIEEAAKALGRTPKSLYKYFSKDLFPRPAHFVKGPTGLKQEAYTESEMRALMIVFGKHQAETPYYGVYHTDTRNALFQCVATKQ